MARNLTEECELWFNKSIDIHNRMLYIGAEEEINEITSEFAIKGISFLNNISEEPITIILNGVGGDYYYSMSIYNAIEESKSRIIIKAYGQAMSGHSLILQAADKRFISKHCKVMIHYGSFGHEDNAKSFKSWAEESEKINKEMEKIYFDRIKAKHPQFKMSELKRMLNFDTILNSKQTVALGLADNIII